MRSALPPYRLDRLIVFEPYAKSRALGGFILIDKITNATVGAGMLHFSLRRAQNVHWQALDVDETRMRRSRIRAAAVLWFTGLSGAGKSTIANLVEKKLFTMNHHTYLLDGDNIRHGLNKDLGFTEAGSRREHPPRGGSVASLMIDAGLIVITAFISPFRSERRMVREMIARASSSRSMSIRRSVVAETRDVKGLYKKARAGKLKNFTGIDSPYEVPEAPEMRIDTTALSPDQAAERIVSVLADLGVLKGLRA